MSDCGIILYPYALILCTVVTLFFILHYLPRRAGFTSEILVPLFISLNQTWKLMSVTVFMGY